MSNLLEIYIDDFAHAPSEDYMNEKLSLFELKVITRFFFRWGGLDGDDLWDKYNSDNREMITDIPLVQYFIDDCKNIEEVESLIRGLV